ncbi:MAG: transposase domain-containing protein, partial [Deltaproteobacteria bacterium]|nr:transposase domain-containing protein [Deltaproteobacteria bacterium]
MARRRKSLPESVDLSHIVSIGFLSKVCPRKVVDDVLTKYDKRSKRVRLLPAGFLVYFIVALALWREPP